MPYKISWYVENRVILNKMSGRMSVEEVEAMVLEVVAYLKVAAQHTDQPVQAIFDQSELEKMPSLPQLVSASEPIRKQTNRQWMILITKDRMTKAVTSILNNVFRSPMKTVPTFDEAINVLKQIDPSLMAEI
jgi:hypothetical protein